MKNESYPPVVGPRGDRRWLVVCSDTKSLESDPYANEKLKGLYALDRGNPPREPIPILAGWSNTVPFCYPGSSYKGGARDQGKKYRASRGSVALERWVS